MYSDKASLTPVRKINYGPNSSQKSQWYTVICLTIIGVCLVGTGTALIIVGVGHDVQDLLILGPVFLVAGVGFTIMMIVIVSRAYFEKRAMKRKSKKGKKKTKKSELKNEGTLGTIEESVPYITDYERDFVDNSDVQKRLSRVQIYGSNKFHLTNNKVSDIKHPGVVDSVSEGYATDENIEYDSEDKILESNPPPYPSLYGRVKSEHSSLFRNPTPPPETSVASGSDIHHSSTDMDTQTGDSKIPNVPTYIFGPAVTPLPNEVETSYM